ncbi:MAG: Nramp family divalent metal transporter [Alphaproteobacteria bacterium]|nr:Nramp family divalent metal transporter [Alphaproteobacteria bacterium]
MLENQPLEEKGGLRRVLGALGPGVITGAADDDPSGIATYSIAGAQFGLGLLWMAPLSWPLMAFVQMMCARIGMVTGQGLAGALRAKFPKPVLVVICLSLLVANTINVASDLAGMADAASLLTGLSSHIFVVLFGVAISWAVVRFRYSQIANLLKWLALALVAYAITAFMAKPDWGQVLRASFSVSLPENGGFATIVAILGTTISPYLFFWQASQEVEEEKAMGRRMLVARQGATHRELGDRKIDVGIGTFFSNIVMFFIILTTALTLNVHGLTTLSTTAEVASALEPLAGKQAMLLYTIGIIGVGLLAIPTLTGSAAYAFSETFRWRHGLDEKWWQARAFYGVIVLSTLAGIAMDFLNINPVSALFWTAVINGVLAPFLLVGILMVARDRDIMHGQPSSLLSQIVVGVTIILMFGAAVGLFVS